MTCHTCNKNGFKSISEMMVHSRSEHPERWVNAVRRPRPRRGRPPKVRAQEAEGVEEAVPGVALQEIIEVLKLKRDGLNKAIEALEQML